MQRRSKCLGSAVAALVLAAVAPAQFTITMTDGSSRVGRITGFSSKAVDMQPAEGQLKLEIGKVLTLHGPATTFRQAGRMLASLGGDVEVCGKVLGGDADGESLTIRTAAIGTVKIELDRISLLRVRQGARFHAKRRFGVGDDPDAELVYRETPLGLDPVKGILARVDERGLRFDWRDNGNAELFAWDKIAGMRLPLDEEDEPAPAVELVLLTDDGCRLRGVPSGVSEGKLLLKSRRLGEVRVALSRIVAGHVLHAASRTFCSSLTPKKVAERTFWQPTADQPWQRDRSVRGAPLATRQKHWTTGIGCHSLSRLTFAAPTGSKNFFCWVGADDSAVGTDVVGEMRFRLFVGGKKVAEQLVKGGQKPKPFRAPVSDGDEVLLELDFAGFADILDRGNWLAPVFLK